MLLAMLVIAESCRVQQYVRSMNAHRTSQTTDGGPSLDLFSLAEVDRSSSEVSFAPPPTRQRVAVSSRSAALLRPRNHIRMSEPRPASGIGAPGWRPLVSPWRGLRARLAPPRGRQSHPATASGTSLQPFTMADYFRYRAPSMVNDLPRADSGGNKTKPVMKQAIRAGLLLAGVAAVCGGRSSMRSGLSQALGAGRIGFTAGVLHSLAGPDHIAGLAALAVNQPVVSAVGLAALWAFGHVAGQFGLGAVLFLTRTFSASIQPLLERWSAIAIAATLLVIGGLGLIEVRAGPEEADLTKTSGTVTKKVLLGTLYTGFIHGLSPDGLVVLLPVIAMPVSRALIYLTGILSGTVAAMAACTAALSATARRLKQYSIERGEAMGKMQTRISVVSSLAAIGIGFLVLGDAFPKTVNL